MKYKNYIKLAALLPLLALLGCETNETPGAESQETVPVTIRLGLEKDGLSTRNSADELDGEDEEDILAAESTINTIDVYVVNSDGSYVVLDKDDFGDDNIATIESLPTGRKEVYAIANYPTGFEDEGELETIQTNPIVNATEKITKNHQFIPMSVHTQWDVTSDPGKTYNVVLVRMVAKMNVTIHDQRSPKTTTRAEGAPKLTIKNIFPSHTALFQNEESTYGNITNTLSHWIHDALDFSNDNKHVSDYVYLHESESKTFDLTFEDGEDVRNGSFSAEIPRNRIFPLVIYLTDYHLDIDVSCSNPPIGVYPNPTTPTMDGYNVTLPAGCEFTFTITPKKSIDNAEWEDDATWSCEVTNNDFKDKNIFVLDDDIDLPNNDAIGNDTQLSFSGHISAVEEQNGNVTLTFTIKDGDAELTFPVVIKIGDLKTRASQALQPIIIEL